MHQEPHFPKDFRVFAVVNDKLRLAYKDSGRIIPLRPGSLIEVIFSEGSLEKGTKDPNLGKWKALKFLPAGTEVYIDVKRPRQKWDGEGIFTNNPLTAADYDTGSQSGATIHLDEDLMLKYAKGKPPKLALCECTFVDTGEKAKSVNHAYTIASQKYEQDRISHTGNVFAKCYYLVPGTPELKSFAARRREIIAESSEETDNLRREDG